MNVKELIKALENMPTDAEVTHLWDGEPRTTIEYVWLSRGGFVVTADCEEVCYSNEARPETAPTEKKKHWWETPQKPGLPLN